MYRHRTPLQYGWSFTQTDEEASNVWMTVKKVPSTVQQDLMDHGKLEDPFLDLNEINAEWVATKSWTYRTNLDVPHFSSGAKTVLAFEGLDTFASVFLNDDMILESDNMFTPQRVDITKFIQPGRHYELMVVFEPALTKAESIRKQHPDHKWLDFVGETSRPAVRKAQYHWGWDWGPVIPCAGIWRPVYLDIYHARIAELRTDVQLSSNLESAQICLTASCETNLTTPCYADVFLLSDGAVVAKQTNVCVLNNEQAFATLSVERPLLWMPAGYGRQPLYEVKIKLFSRDQLLDVDCRKIGIRKTELVQEHDAYGKSFYMRVNNVDIFCGGACWIPADSLLTNITSERYRSWIAAMIAANQNMIRVWAGGVYEDDALYDACDELGVLVFQDFMFACANYPAHSSFIASVTDEARANVRRLRHHPSLLLFAGNNEDYQVQEALGLTYNYDDKNEENWLKSDFPARYIYESILPRVVSEEAPWIPYHPGSPWGDGKLSYDATVGDKHAWNVWHHPQEMYQIFDKLGGRFNSEFGMSALPHLSTIQKFVTNSEDLHPQSLVLDFHNKSDGGDRRIAAYMVENVSVAVDLQTYIYLSQLVQSDALSVAFRGWRKQWGSQGDRKCGGALVWQLNDCWPCTSWSICDYYLTPKASYHSIRRALAPVAIGVQREHYDWNVSHPRTPETQSWELWAVNTRLKTMQAEVELSFICVETGEHIRPKIRQTTALIPNGTTHILTGKINNFTERPHVLAARLLVDGRVVARDMDWPQPLKYLRFPARNVRVRFSDGQARVTVDKPVKCLVFEESEGRQYSDNALDLAPDDEQIVVIEGLKDSQQFPGYIYLGQREQTAP